MNVFSAWVFSFAVFIAVAEGCALEDIYCLACEPKTRIQLEKEDYECRFEAEHGGRDEGRCDAIRRQPCKDC